MLSDFVLMVIIVSIILCAIVLLIVRLSFGTFSLSKIIKQYEERKKLEKAYDLKFQKRDNLLYHISWAKVRVHK